MAFRAYAPDVPSRTRARVWHLGPMPQTVSNLPLQPSQSSGALWLKAMCDTLWLTAMCDALWLTAMCDALWLTAMCDALWLTAMCDALWLTTMCDALWLTAMCDALWLTAMCDALWLTAMCDALWLTTMCDALWLTAMCDALWLTAMCDALWLTAMCDALWLTTKGLISLHISSLATLPPRGEENQPCTMVCVFYYDFAHSAIFKSKRFWNDSLRCYSETEKYTAILVTSSSFVGDIHHVRIIARSV
ncbi:hypothetical protein M8J77_023119 [Diaphorina citri]|nr:hypothetical protein M8J77_023119 [Diaphorina citri]